MPVFLTKRASLAIRFFLILLAVSAGGQVRIQSHPGMDVPREKVSLLFNVTCRVVAEEFRLGDASELRVPDNLVLGEARDGVMGDETEQVFAIYMSPWDETMFATAVSRIALQHLVSRDRKARIVGESLRRAHRIAPISKDALQAANHQIPQSSDQLQHSLPLAHCSTRRAHALLHRLPHLLQSGRITHIGDPVLSAYWQTSSLPQGGWPPLAKNHVNVGS
ncbi:MAG: hypothetical protein LAO56_21720 [Acidobacteriia bacterium]|nr:hypothetical protein [Terriglobia bacterium]